MSRQHAPKAPLLRSVSGVVSEAGCDEAGRGCLCGPVCAAAVILPDGFSCPELDDSKKLSPQARDLLRSKIESEAIAWTVAFVSNEEIDRINILNASILAMHKALDGLDTVPKHIAVDGNRFKPYRDIPHTTVVKGDAKYMNIAAASILAKTHRDEFMVQAAELYPQYGWEKSMGYPTPEHLAAIEKYGLTPLHRLSFGPCKKLLL